MAIRHSENKNNTRLSLEDVLKSANSLGLLSDVKAKQTHNPDSQLFERFEAINVFIDKHKRLPSLDAEDFNEKSLANRLLGFQKGNPTKQLAALDRYSILSKTLEAITKAPEKPNQVKEVSSLKDIFKSDRLGLLNTSNLGIFDIKHVPATTKVMPDEIAQRTTCGDFYEFAPIFSKAHKNIVSSNIEIVPFKQGSQINKGDIFILKGMLCLVDEICKFEGGADEPYNPRLRVIFENATESNLLLRSLAAALYKDEHSRRLLADSDNIVEAFNNIGHKDKRTGVIYIVASLSDNPVIQSRTNLYKIGYTELTVEERTKNAINDTAFLESPIRIVASIECFNLNPNRFETLIHAFLSSQRLLIELYSKDGKKYKPQEWFQVPLETAREVIKRIIDGTIIQYRMDNTTGKIIKKL